MKEWKENVSFNFCASQIQTLVLPIWRSNAFDNEIQNLNCTNDWESCGQAHGSSNSWDIVDKDYNSDLTCNIIILYRFPLFKTLCEMSIFPKCQPLTITMYLPTCNWNTLIEIFEKCSLKGISCLTRSLVSKLTHRSEDHHVFQLI